MALTRSWEGTPAGKLEILATAKQLDRRRELIWLSIASALICAGLVSVFLAKTEDAAPHTAAIERGEIINLNRVASAEQILPALQVVSPDERGEIAGQIYAMRQRRSLPNVGALARLTVFSFSSAWVFAEAIITATEAVT